MNGIVVAWVSAWVRGQVLNVMVINSWNDQAPLDIMKVTFVIEVIEVDELDEGIVP